MVLDALAVSPLHILQQKGRYKCKGSNDIRTGSRTEEMCAVRYHGDEQEREDPKPLFKFSIDKPRENGIMLPYERITFDLHKCLRYNSPHE